MNRYSKLTIKNYRSCRANEGDAWSATLYFEGQKVGEAKYEGNGGPTDCTFWKKVKGKVVWDKEAEKKVREYCESQPDIVDDTFKDDDGKPYTYKADMELIVNEVVTDFLEEQKLRRWCKTQVVVKMKGMKRGEYQAFKADWTKQATQVKAFLAKKYPGQVEEIVNERFAA